MTVENTNNTISYTGNGSVTTFAYNFLVYQESHIFVYLDDILQTVSYSVTGVGDEGGGNIVFNFPPPTGVIVRVDRTVPETQLIEYQEYGPFPAKTNERGLDLLTMAVQQNLREIGRVASTKMDKRPLANRNNIVLFDEDGNSLDSGINLSDISGGGVPTIGKITRFLNDEQTNFKDAYEQCCIDFDIVDLEGLTLVTSDEIVVPANSRVKEVLFNGADITVLSSKVEYEGFFPKHKGPGKFKGGSLLKQVAVTSGTDTNVIQLKDVDGLEVGQYVNSSLDIYYLPNASDRAGYIDEGDFNRITSINTNTNVITLAYNFLRTADYTVSSGLIENSWIGINTTFESSGVSSTSTEQQELYFEDLEMSNWAGYIANRFDIEDDPLELKSEMTFINCKIHTQFLDVLRFRGKNLTFKGNKVDRIYDFAKQFVAYSMNPEGVILLENNDIATHNGDNTFYASGLAKDSPANSGMFISSGNTYTGTKPEDLPESDFNVPPVFGQLYYGIQVPIHDSYHWHAAGAGNDGYCRGITSTGDTWIGFQRGIFGTTFVHNANFSYGSAVFNNADASCEPLYISTLDKTNDELLQENKIILNGGNYNSRNGLFCRGAAVYANDINLTLTDENRQQPQVGNGFVALNNVVMNGGTLNGRYKIESNYALFTDVHLAYQGTDDPANVVLFGIDTLSTESNFILDVPDDFENTGLGIDDWAGDIPVVAWFGSNASGFAPTPNLKFRLSNRSNSYVYGNNFAKPYFQNIVTAKVNAPPSSTKGLFSAKLGIGDTISGMADNTLQTVTEAAQATVTTNVGTAGATGDIEVADAPLYTPTHIAVFKDQFKSWFYYTVASVSGNVVTPNENITSDFDIGDSVYLIQAKAGGADTVVTWQFGGTMEIGRINELTDANTGYLLPPANGFSANEYLVISQTVDTAAIFNPEVTVNDVATETIITDSGTDTSIKFEQSKAAEVRFTTDGISQWRLTV